MTDKAKLDIQDQYYLALGKAIHAYSELETTLQVILWIITNTSPLVAKAVFSGIKTATACDYIRRTFRASNTELPEILERALSRTKVLNEIRNDIVHYGARFEGDEIHVTNDLMALPGKARKTQISPSDLDDIRTDINTIRACLMSHVVSRTPGVPSHMKEQYEKTAQTPWRYKSG